MPAVKTNHFEGGRNLTKHGDSGADLASILRSSVDDNTELRTQFIALLAKLDADVGVTDTDYAATLTPAALTLTKA